MKRQLGTGLVFLLLVRAFPPALADEYKDTIKVFQDAGESGSFSVRVTGMPCSLPSGRVALASADLMGRAESTRGASTLTRPR